MSAATNFNFSVIVIPSAVRSAAANLDFPTLNQSLSFALEVSSPSDFQTLYSEDTKGGNTFKGLLYVPDLDPSDPCDNHDLVPRNVTRKANLPMDDLKLVAYAPLITQHCSRQYMYSAENDNVAAFIFYGVPAKYSNNTDPLEGEGYPFEYPVYYLDGSIGQPLMNKLSEYSANMSEVYNGFNLTEAGYDIRDYARIYAVISTKNTNPMPGLWLFLLVVVAVLLFIIGASSLLMHLFQFHYRRSLRRRIANGEVDLEGLGVGRITVPREFLAKFPLYVYIAENGGQTTPPRQKVQDTTAPTTQPVPKEEGRRKERVKIPSAVVVKEGVSIVIPATITAERKSKGKERVKEKPRSPTAIDATTSPEMAEVSTSKGLTLSSPTTPSTTSRSSPKVQYSSTPSPQPRGTQTPTTTSPPHPRGYHQTSCPICLDDFIHQETTVRELPCLHIFHPECIDPYLKSQSSLCVLCKQSCLPKGYVPIRLTNSIVRRERLLRSIRERSREVATATAANNGGNNGEGGILWRWRLRRLRRQEQDLMGRQALVRVGRGRGGGFGLGPHYREQRVVEDVVRPRWRETMDRVFPGFR
ncbi:uncharacterized protein DFL_005167 [Arthrobotrys flagrans]|uniref:RING-type domain-containing protein n=1 Tax=Arthrobotrys flagrans TaxID=97331 RepID=A0A437A727_ARTFL|nr:hypothetical protein DFL_005167 [Arthrobotrys flagrans]